MEYPFESSKLINSVISTLLDCIIANPVRESADESYKLSGPRGIGSTKGSKLPNGEWIIPVKRFNS